VIDKLCYLIYFDLLSHLRLHKLNEILTPYQIEAKFIKLIDKESSINLHENIETTNKD
jgi:hypothetical protein